MKADKLNPLAVGGIAGGAALSIYLLVIRPWHLRWGATDEEIQWSLPGDDLVPYPRMEATHAITIRASATDFWPWIVQMGQGRGGFYSYDWLENLFGLDIHSANKIIPEFQNLEVGDVVPFWRDAGVTVIAVEPDRALLLAATTLDASAEGVVKVSELKEGDVGGSWVFVLDEVDEGTTRLIVRTRVADFRPSWLSWVFCRLLLEPAAFIMERKALLSIKERVER